MRLTLTHKSAVPHSDRITMEHLDKTKNMNAGQLSYSLAFSGQIHFTISAKIPPKQNAHTCCDGLVEGFSVTMGRLSQHRLQTFFSRLTSSYFAAGFSMTGRIFASEFLHQVQMGYKNSEFALLSSGFDFPNFMEWHFFTFR